MDNNKEREFEVTFALTNYVKVTVKGDYTRDTAENAAYSKLKQAGLQPFEAFEVDDIQEVTPEE